MVDDSAPRTAQRVFLPVTAVLVFANLVAIFVERLAVQQTYSFLLIVLCQALANGLVLVAWRPSRRMGVGLLFGTVSAAVAFAMWIFFFLIPNFE